MWKVVDTQNQAERMLALFHNGLSGSKIRIIAQILTGVLWSAGVLQGPSHIPEEFDTGSIIQNINP